MELQHLPARYKLVRILLVLQVLMDHSFQDRFMLNNIVYSFGHYTWIYGKCINIVLNKFDIVAD